LSGLLILISLGIGALNELIELIAVVFLGATEGVGGYINNALDIVFNLFGAVISCIYIWFHYEKDKIKGYVLDKVDNKR
jgi:hypothetical protein